MTKYDKVIQIFQERLEFKMTAAQEMSYIALIADHPSVVDQFSLFNEEFFKGSDISCVKFIIKK